jgi:hypothetical protein
VACTIFSPFNRQPVSPAPTAQQHLHSLSNAEGAFRSGEPKKSVRRERIVESDKKENIEKEDETIRNSHHIRQQESGNDLIGETAEKKTIWKQKSGRDATGLHQTEKKEIEEDEQ